MSKKCPLTRTNLQHKKSANKAPKNNHFDRNPSFTQFQTLTKLVKKKQKKLAFHKYCCVILYLAQAAPRFVILKNPEVSGRLYKYKHNMLVVEIFAHRSKW